MASNAVWGIDVGQCALRAIKLQPGDEGKVEVAAFDVVEHDKILSQPDAEPGELIKEALEKFVSRNEIQGDQFVIGVPGQQTFAKFCKLPPVEQKKIPDIVKFEASQQIPFDMDDVVWDYEVFQEDDSPDVEVGIFAMRKDLIRSHLDNFTEMRITPQVIQTLPSALYNFCIFDRSEEVEEGSATVLIHVGAQNTDLVVVEPNSAWSRTIPLGGNRFTEELVKKFKLSFSKAEQLKRNAAKHKQARQIFQAMRPIFAELVSEVQRSIGFYSSTHRDIELKRVLACGNAFRLSGLRKYLEQNLTVAGGVHELNEFQNVMETPTTEADLYKENVMGLATAYGLALQGLGVAKISANLLPPELARVAMWRKKRPLFVAAAACAGFAAAMPWTRLSLDSAAMALNKSEGDAARSIIQRAQGFSSRYAEAAGGNEAEKTTIEDLMGLTENRALVPKIMSFVHASLPAIDPTLASVQTPEKLKQLIESNPGRYARTQRRQILIDSLEVKYEDDVVNAQRATPTKNVSGVGGFSRGASSPAGGMQPGGMGGFTRGGGMRGPGGNSFQAPKRNKGAAEPGFQVVLSGRLLWGTTKSEAAQLIFEEFYPQLMQNSRQKGLGFYLPTEDAASPTQQNLDTSISIQKVYSAANASQRGFQMPGEEVDENAALFPDPITGEDMIHDWSFQFTFKVLLGDPPEEETDEEEAEEDESNDRESRNP